MYIVYNPKTDLLYIRLDDQSDSGLSGYCR